MLPGDLQSMSHVTLKLGHAYLITHVIYPVSPRLCLPPAIPLTAIEITTVDPKGSLPAILLCEPVFKRFSNQPLGRTDAFVHAMTVLSPPCLYSGSCQACPLCHEFLCILKHVFLGCHPHLVLTKMGVHHKPLTFATTSPASTSHRWPDTASSSAPVGVCWSRRQADQYRHC